MPAYTDVPSDFPDIIGTSPALRTILDVLPRIAATSAPVLLIGESGTGKQLLARSVHRHSRRAAGPFVTMKCTALSDELMRAEMLGRHNGLANGDGDVSEGRLAQAHTGSLFLDGVGDLSLDAQATLLRVLETREVTPVGTQQPTPVDVRIIAATHRDLDAAMAAGAFREDLYWRLHVVPLRLPPLRERAGDLAPLTDFLVQRLSLELKRPITGVSPDVRQLLATHDWPGNIRELENVLRRAVIVARGPHLQLEDLPIPLERPKGIVGPLTLAEAVARATERVERTLIETALMQHHGSRTATADGLGINRKTLFRKMRRYGMTGHAEEHV